MGMGRETLVRLGLEEARLSQSEGMGFSLSAIETFWEFDSLSCLHDERYYPKNGSVKECDYSS